ncbi:hypothetical protein [Planomonospora parontospora]|uniref:hypothetical protein n=1 Tax=Planomonospora parontospora TaxID=58119 RepID=UPI001670F012|nr:hypothetical protein [Planomonospora parontospora]GGL23688.1 hypothetical protein GCM10014719_26770 [Planomonospora parontospora subsp. antibiotica]GII15040.1 hypothetical protein Ppa05_17660 [Planomonospora parontospora subsp. antibiotica]
MILAVLQGFGLVAACLNVVLGIYVLTTNRLPPLVPIRKRDYYKPRRYGWGVLLMAAFVFLLVLGQWVMDWSPELALVLMIPMIGSVIAGSCLLLSAKSSQRVS